MTKTDLRKAAGLSSSSLAKLGKGENVTTDVLLRICETLGVKLHDIVDSVEDKKRPKCDVDNKNRVNTKCQRKRENKSPII